MKKFLLTLLLAMALVIPANAETKTITITPETMQTGSSSNKYVTTAFTFSEGDFTFKTNQVNPSNGQLRISTTGNGAFTISNTTAIPNIKSIAFTFTDNSTSTIGTWYAKTGDSEVTALATTSDIAGNKGSFTIPESTSVSFFRISLTTKGTGALYFSKIEITYDDTPAGPVEPGDVLVNGKTASTEPIEAVDGETITFTSDKAAKLEYLSEELDLLDEVTGSTYTHAADFSKGNTYQITVTPYDSDNKEYTEKAVTVTISKKLVTPEAVLVNGAAATQEPYELAQGEEITFTSANATKLEYESEELELIDEITGSSFTHTAQFTDELKEYKLTVKPVDNFGKVHDELAVTVTIQKIAAPLCGAITFTPADGAVYAGNAVTIVCENATEIKYTINGGEELTYDAATGVEITAACTIVAWGINADGVKGAEKELNVTIKEADRYVLINRVSDIKPGAKYILYGQAKTDDAKNKYALMGGISGKFCEAILLDNECTEIITVGENDFDGLNVFQINVTSNGKYTIQFSDGNYLVISGSDFTTSATSSNWDISFSGSEVKISSGSAKVFYNASSPRFKPYTSNTMAPVYLYRLIDDEYYTDEAPIELHIHGSHFSGSWAASSQFDQTAPGVFTFNGFLAYEEGEAAPAIVFSTAAFPTAGDTEITGIRPRKAAPAADYWNDIEGDVFMPETDGATVGTHKLVRVSTKELAEGTASLNTFTADHNNSYDLTVDFNGYSPVATLAAHDDSKVPTGVENIDAAETAEVEYFNLSGLRVANPENGIFIRRQGNKVTKVLVK